MYQVSPFIVFTAVGLFANCVKGPPVCGPNLYYDTFVEECLDCPHNPEKDCSKEGQSERSCLNSCTTTGKNPKNITLLRNETVIFNGRQDNKNSTGLVKPTWTSQGTKARQTCEHGTYYDPFIHDCRYCPADVAECDTKYCHLNCGAKTRGEKPKNMTSSGNETVIFNGRQDNKNSTGLVKPTWTSQGTQDKEINKNSTGLLNPTGTSQGTKGAFSTKRQKEERQRFTGPNTNKITVLVCVGVVVGLIAFIAFFCVNAWCRGVSIWRREERREGSLIDTMDSDLDTRR